MTTTSDLQDINLKEALMTYEQLQDIEDDFEDVEVEILRQQDKLSREIYAKREKVIEKIPQFWPLVFEQAPPEIDEYVQPSDAGLIMNSLIGLSVERFELPNGDPRSFSIKLQFKENEYFENKTLEKKFWWRFAKDGWTGLVSEPVAIQWKTGKDLTNGMLDKVIKVWEEEKAGQGENGQTETAKALIEQMENTGLGGLSFFAWFGFRGRKISEEENKEAAKKFQERRAARKASKETEPEDDEDEDEDEDGDEDGDEYELEIFPTGDDLALCIAEDLWPSAIKYFTNGQEDDSDEEFESDDEMADDDEEDEPVNKKRKA